MRNWVVVGLLSWSGIIAVSCSSTEGESTLSPSMNAPSGLTATPMGTGVHLRWKDTSSDEDAFEVERKPSGPDRPFQKIASVEFDIPQFHDIAVTAGVAYTYRVRAVSAAERSLYSNEVNVIAPTSAAGEAKIDAGGGAGWDGGTVSFSQHIVPLFQRSCGAGNTSCHARDAYAATSNRGCRGWVSLENAPLGAKFYGSGANAGQPTGCPDRSLYARLVELDAWQEPNAQLRKYIKPNDPASSYLFNKIAGGPYGEDRPGVPSAAMPLDATLPVVDIAMVKKWIESGAPEN